MTDVYPQAPPRNSPKQITMGATLSRRGGMTVSDNPTPIRLAFIGCGGMSRAHLGAWRALAAKGAAFTVVAAADAVPALAEGHARNVAEWQADAPAAVYTDWRRMLEEARPDAVDVCTPHHLHHEVAVACMEAGVDVIVEKPLGVTLRAGRRMLAAARRTGRILAVAEQVRRWPGPRALAWAAEGGPLGRPLLASIQHVGGSRRNPEATAASGPMPWRLDRTAAGGGVVLDVGVHMTDMLLYCFGPIRRVTATTRCYGDLPYADGRRPSVEDGANILLEFESGMSAAWVHASAVPGQAVHNNTYHGTGGSVVAQGFYPQMPRFTRWDHQQTLEPEAFVAAYLETLDPAERQRLFPAWIAEDPLHAGGGDIGIEYELADFLEAVRTRRAPEVGGAEGLAAQAVAVAVLESAHLGGQPLLVDDVAAGRVAYYQDPIDEALGLL